MLCLVCSGCNESPNNHSVGEIDSYTDSILNLYRVHAIYNADYISLIDRENIFVSNPKVGDKKWIDSANIKAFDDSMRCLIGEEARQIHLWIWSLPEMSQHLEQNKDRGLSCVYTQVHPIGDSTWYHVEVHRDYFERIMHVIPFGLLIVNPQSREIVVRDPIVGDLPLAEWRRMEY